VPATALKLYRVTFTVAFIVVASICTHPFTESLSTVLSASAAGGLAFIGLLLANLIFRR
jgi:Sec-independent protein secretion pathway component TatC